ncbi:unnamed protein product [Triticum turgidum subsp. durum]|uniref:Uncharacterized protein n=1 Tax=Triticum turgidum subsp. durum TaxID=4567 RepID=A0A9R1BRF6_TRITD|nr:unnamed protein product [Triticum turgidum subsp. durum]
MIKLKAPWRGRTFLLIGDECIMAVNQPRHTHDWDEVTGKWKPRGIWLFLKVLSSHEEKHCLPLSGRQK